MALAYGKYRAKRAAEREHGAEEANGLRTATGTRHARAIADIRARISFARIGLHPTLADEDLVARLLRSTSINLTAAERSETIVLNAKSLLDVDADARFFAARILLSYIYEETLPWKVSDGPQALKEAHSRAFIEYIPHGIALSRLDPRLAEYDLRELASALDPFADLQFDFIGIQTLYDRYLIHAQETRNGTEAPAGSAANFLDACGHGARAAGERAVETRAIEFYCDL